MVIQSGQISKRTDFATNLGRCHFSDENRPSSEGHALANANEHTAEDEDANFMTGSESLDDRCNNGNKASNAHTPSSPKKVGLSKQSVDVSRLWQRSLGCAYSWSTNKPSY
jgi:hypothetical protein